MSIIEHGINTGCFLKLTDIGYSDVTDIKKGYDMKVLSAIEIGHVSGSGSKHKQDKHKHHKHDKHSHGHGHGHGNGHHHGHGSSGCNPAPSPC